MATVEKLFHVALRTSFEKQPALAAALKSIARAGYDEIGWQATPAPLRVRKIVEKVSALRPTIIFMQLQSKDALDAKDIEFIRKAAGNPTIISWDGDLRDEPADPGRKWFVELGKVIDASLVTNTVHPPIYKSLGVRGAGYMQIGIDENIYKPATPARNVPEIVFLASKYDSHSRRDEVVAALSKRYKKRFGVFGHGWNKLFTGHGMLRQDQEAAVYTAAKCAISMSIRNDLPSYTSDRLFRALASGAVTLVEDFPGLLELGVVPNINAYVWKTIDELISQIDYIINFDDPWLSSMRAAASSLARTAHSWQARMPELLEIVKKCRSF